VSEESSRPCGGLEWLGVRDSEPGALMDRRTDGRTVKIADDGGGDGGDGDAAAAAGDSNG